MRSENVPESPRSGSDNDRTALQGDGARQSNMAAYHTFVHVHGTYAQPPRVATNAHCACVLGTTTPLPGQDWVPPPSGLQASFPGPRSWVDLTALLQPFGRREPNPNLLGGLIYLPNETSDAS